MAGGDVVIPYATSPLTFVLIDGWEFAVYASDRGASPRSDAPAGGRAPGTRRAGPSDLHVARGSTP